MAEEPVKVPSGTVSIPGLGKVKSVYFYGGVAVVGVLAIVYYRSHQAGTSSTSTTPASSSTGTIGASDPYPSDGSVGNASDPNSVDPFTGVTYGDEATGYGSGGFGAGYGGGVGGLSTTSPNTGPGTFTTNGDWSQYAISYLVGQGMDSSTVTNDLGLYINGQPVTSAQEQVINDAIAIAGTPPVSGPGNHPPSINVAGSKTGTTKVVSVPNLKGMTTTAAVAKLKSVGLVAGAHATEAGTVNGQTPGPGVSVPKGSKVDLSVAPTGTNHGGNPPHLVKVPAVVGQSVSAAKATISKAGLTARVSGNRTSGTINSQTPGAGKSVISGSVVDLGVK